MKNILIYVFALIYTFSINAQNLLNNGTFEFGGPGYGFWVDGQGYIQLNTPYSGSTSAGNYAFVANPQVMNTLIFSSSADHTSGNGKMMVIDGNTTGGQQRFWKAGDNGGGICNLQIGQSYEFSYWVKTVSNSIAGNSELADIRISINNASAVTLAFGTTLAPIPNFGWLQVRYTFTATSTCVNIELYNENTNAIGNDFALDDLSLRKNNIPLDFTYSITQPNCAEENSGMIVIYPTGGQPPYLFQINGQQPQAITNDTGIFQYVELGTYTIGLMDANGVIDSVQQVIVSPISPIEINPTDTSVCPNTALIFQATGGANYQWSASPNDPELLITNLDSIQISPNNTTTYTASATISNLNSIYNGDFEAGNTGFVTDYTFYAPSNPSGVQRGYGVVTNPSNWFPTFNACIDHTLGNGFGKMLVVDGSTYNLGTDEFWSQTVAVEPNKHYVFSFWVSSLTALNLAQIKTQINGIDLGTYSVLTQNCAWNQISYNWNSGSNLIATISLSDFNYQGNGNDFAVDDISLKTTSVCSAEVTVTMATANPDYGLSYPTNICINEGLVSPVLGPDFLTGGFFNVIQPGINIDNLSGVLNPIGSIPGTYELTYTAQVCGVFIPDTHVVVIRPLPTLVEFTGGDYNCSNHEFNSLNLLVTGSPNFSVSYSLDGVSQELTGVSSSLIALSNSPGVYVLDSLSDAFCTNSISGTQTISIADAPITPEILGDSNYCLNSTVQPLYIVNVTTGIRWYSNSALTNYLGDNSELLPSNQTTQTYYATQTINNCESLPDSFTVYIKTCNIDIPTAFTPNNDGTNDVWNITGLDTQFPKNTVKVFNRWGELLFESLPGTYSSKPWDGTYKSLMLPVSSYYFVIDLTDDGTLDPLNGIVSIILKK